MDDLLAELDAVGQADLVARGDATAIELLDAAIERIQRVEPQLNAITCLDVERARRRAAANPAGRFAGVPLLMKDLLAYPGIRCASGSRLLAAYVPDAGSPYTDRLDDAGFVALGKTTTSEFGLLGSTETLLEGITRNPWNRDISAAGSSGGAAAAVASGMVPLAHASDGGGSIRIPASVCGVFGLKPSRGRHAPSLPQEGPMSLLVSEHCVSRSVRDSAMLLSLTERTGADAVFPPVGYVDGPVKRRLRIGTYTRAVNGDEPSPEVRQALDATAALCAGLGHEVVHTTCPFEDERVADAFFTVAGAGVTAMRSMLEPILGRPIGGDDIEPFTVELLEWFAARPVEAVDDAVALFATASKRYLGYFDEFDVALTPTLTREPYGVGHLAPTLSWDTLVERTVQWVGFTPIVNMAGATAMSVPLGQTDGGLPLGSHFVARPGDEMTLLGLAYELEQAAPWAGRWPPISVPRLGRS